VERKRQNEEIKAKQRDEMARSAAVRKQELQIKAAIDKEVEEKERESK
jgi:hypothetical protein